MNVDHDLLLVLRATGLGEGEPDLGAKLLRAFLTQLLESGTLPHQLICINAGVFLTTRGSPLLDLLGRFADGGTRVQSCGTCLEYYGRKDALELGEVGNMRETVQAMLSHSKVLQP